MAEMDTLERRVVAALLGHAGEVPDAVDAAAVARRVALEHPRRRTSVLRWRSTGVPRVAWVLLLVALLTAMVAGLLVVGMQLERKVPAVVPPVGQVFACPPGSNPEAPGSADQARPPGVGPMAFDRAAGKIVVLGRAGTWTFDVCSNTWTQMQVGAVPDPARAIVYEPGADLIISVDDPDDPAARPPRAWAYGLADNTWTRRGPAPAHVERLWYDAASAQVVAWTAKLDVDAGTIWTYDAAADTWAAVGALEALGGFGWGHPGNDLLAYDASLDRVVATVIPDRGQTRLFDMHTGAVVEASPVAPWAGACGTFVSMYCYGGVAGAAIAYDDHVGRTAVLIGGAVFTYDAAADRWETLYVPGDADTSDAVASANAAAGALARESWSMVFDPVNGRLVVPGGADGAVLAFDATTRAWTVLLEPRAVQPAPTP